MRGLPTWSKRRYAAAWRERATAAGALTYVAIGDSAAQGLGASTPWSGYVGLLAAAAETRAGAAVRVVNLSVSGAKARDVLDLQIPLVADLEPDVVTCAVGGNDVRRLDLADFRETMTGIVEALPEHALIADTPCFYEGRGEEKSRAAASVIRDILADRGRSPVELHRATEARTREYWRGDFALDFFHPSDRGYTVWASAFEPLLLDRVDVVTKTTGGGATAPGVGGPT
ncbi:SGNH/GDSL hydrolase family protein [Marisediminicola sp. LYQ134]|uniref:SGNH/GDSL hydrolase family protein n=1 Tax=unclassified Marisediminicola TaxID=2618316 RepID=UPI0039833745